MWDYEVHASPEVAERYGMASARIGGGVALAVRDDVTEYWSKALGLGFEEPVTAKLVTSILDFYRENGNKFAMLQLAPSVLPVDWEEICAAEGLVAESSWVKLSRSTGQVVMPETSLRVAEVDVHDAEEWAAVLVQGFGMPQEQVAPAVQGAAGLPGWSMFGAFDGDRMVAAAGLMVRGDVAEIAGASTLPEFQRRGAQSALLAARIRKAAAAGATLLSVETAVPAEGTRSISLNNLLRAGFKIRYERQNWTWRA